MENIKIEVNQDLIIDSCNKPPLGLIPKRFHDKNVKIERYNDVCSAIARYYHARLKIKIEWIEEYNELVDYLNKNEKE